MTTFCFGFYIVNLSMLHLFTFKWAERCWDETRDCCRICKDSQSCLTPWQTERGFHSRSVVISGFKGTQDWEFFWLRFWNLRYFFVSYVKILRFSKKNFLIGPLLGEVRFFRVVIGLRRMKKNFELGPKKFFSSSILDPKYDPILIFWKFNHLNAPGTTLCVDVGSKCHILFPLVWD